MTLDDSAVLAGVDADPEGLLSSLMENLDDESLIIDEAQRSKRLALSIKKMVDGNRRKGQFVLTGSSNVFTTMEVADSLAGRMRTLKLWPLSAAEISTVPVNRLMDWAMQEARRSPRWLTGSHLADDHALMPYWQAAFRRSGPCR